MNKIKIGIVGLNFGGRLIDDEIIKGPGAAHLELAAVCDVDARRLMDFATSHGVPGYSDIDQLLADKNVEAVGLFTGPAGCAKLLRRLIRAGKDVLTTKPFELNAAEGLSVLNEARDLGRVIHLNSPGPRLSPDLALIDQWRTEHKLGRPVAARADIWAAYREQPDGTWYDDPEQCPVAPIFRLGIYLINDLIRLLGQPVAVSVMRSRLFTSRPTDDNAQLAIEFENGALANVFASFCVNDGQSWLSSLTLNYENGTVYRNVGPTAGHNPRREPELALVIGDGVANWGKRIVHKAVAPASTEDYQYGYFQEAVRGNRRSDEISPEQVAAGIRVIAAMGRAQRTGCKEKI